MLNLKYIGEKNSYEISFKKVNEHIVQLTGDFPVKSKGFVIYRDDMEDDLWDYKNFKTIYRQTEEEGIVQFSDDGSVYVEPVIPEPVESEPYVPTLDEVKAVKKQEIALMYQVVKVSGIDIKLSTGTQHFTLSDEDVTFLMGKQIELSTGVSEVAYQDSDNHCIILSSEDMQTIITAALAFVDVQTTYRNNLYEWVDACENEEEVAAVTYGVDIPAEYQNEVYKRKLELIANAKEDKMEE